MHNDIMINGIITYLCYRSGMATLPMITLMAGELTVYLLSAHIVIVPVPFGVGTTVFQEAYDHFRNKPKVDYYLLTANQKIE